MFPKSHQDYILHAHCNIEVQAKDKEVMMPWNSWESSDLQTAHVLIVSKSR